MIKKICFSFTFLVTIVVFETTCAQSFVSDQKKSNYFPVVSDNETASIYTDVNDYILVQKSAEWLQNDVKKATGKTLPILHSLASFRGNIIIIGSKEKSSAIRDLLKKNLLKTKVIEGKWDGYLLQSVTHPFKNIEHALIIMGNDKRGAAYGTFELSKQAGVSPWYWWADVPVKKKDELYVSAKTFVTDFPKVKYRGIFLNDEAPALSGWAKEKFGGFNHLFYEKVFELILRLKGNYLWPAMWGNAFNDDDTLNPILANEYGIVMGTSHHEPMLRAQQEWKRYGKGPWNYETNDSMLRAFWRKGIENMDHHESIVTIGMRGDGDKPMTQGTAIALLERIVKDQRKIIEDVTRKPASETPQDWALYKEVQEYYDKGMRVPDDVTLLLCDDNWGNIRKLPKLTDKPRSGGYGIYYHFDYVGGPRNYKWINTNNIARVWEQMHLAYSYGVKNIWIVNVGDLKPMELPINFFLDYAWDPDKWNENNITSYFTHWAAEQFGEHDAQEIANILEKYSQYASRRKPELLDANTYSVATGEWYRVLKQWQNLLTQAQTINDSLPEEYKDAYFELVLHPVTAMENLHALYFDVAMNQQAYKNKSASTNQYADNAKVHYEEDSLLSLQYNQLDNGKWDHMMDQTHIGYTYWQQPLKQKMPEVKYLPADSVVRQEQQVTFPQTSQNNIPPNTTGNIFYEEQGYVSIEAAHYTKSVNSKNIQWKVIPGIGRDGDGITTFPVTTSCKSFDLTNPHLEYNFYTYDSGECKADAYFSPTLNFHNMPEGLQFAISIDNETPQVISLNKETDDNRAWDKWVANNIIIKSSTHKIREPGKHTVKYWMINGAVILQKLVLDFGGDKPGYLGPPETIFNHQNE